jgi:hypothetical protein
MLWVGVRSVVSFNLSEEGNIFRNVVWCYIMTVEKVKMNVSGKKFAQPQLNFLVNENFLYVSRILSTLAVSLGRW